MDDRLENDGGGHRKMGLNTSPSFVGTLLSDLQTLEPKSPIMSQKFRVARSPTMSVVINRRKSSAMVDMGRLKCIVETHEEVRSTDRRSVVPRHSGIFMTEQEDLHVLETTTNNNEPTEMEEEINCVRLGFTEALEGHMVPKRGLLSPKSPKSPMSPSARRMSSSFKSSFRGSLKGSKKSMNPLGSPKNGDKSNLQQQQLQQPLTVKEMSPLERFQWAAKKTVWRIKQRMKAVNVIATKGASSSAGYEHRLAPFGSMGAVVDVNTVTVQYIKELYVRELSYFRSRTISVQGSDLFLNYPRLSRREKVLSSVYLQQILKRHAAAHGSRKAGIIKRVIADLYSKISMDDFALGIWQFASGPDISSKIIIESGNGKILERLVYSHTPMCISALWALAHRFPDIRDYILVQLNIVDTITHEMLNPEEWNDNFVGLVACLSCCEKGIYLLAEHVPVKYLFEMLVQVELHNKAAIVQTIANLWPVSQSSLVKMKEDISEVHFDLLMQISEASLLENIAAFCVFAQIAQTTPKHPSFLTERALKLIITMGTQGYLERSKMMQQKGGGEERLIQHRDVALQCVCTCLYYWISSLNDDDLGLLDRGSGEILTCLKNIFATPNEKNQLKAMYALLVLFQRSLTMGNDKLASDACMLLLAKVRVLHHPEITKLVFRDAFNSPEALQVLNRHEALGLVLNMMKRYITEKETLIMASLAALKLALAPNVQSISVTQLLSLLQSSSSSARNALLCVLYGVTVGHENVIIQLSSKQECFDTVLRVLSNVSMDFAKPLFELVTLVLWRMFRRFEGPENKLEDFANTVVAHLGGNCAHLRQSVIRYLDFENEIKSQQEQADRMNKRLLDKNVLNISFEQEVQMWTAVSYKRSLLETDASVPRALRASSSVIGFFETKRQAQEAYITYEKMKERNRNRHLKPIVKLKDDDDDDDDDDLDEGDEDNSLSKDGVNETERIQAARNARTRRVTTVQTHNGPFQVARVSQSVCIRLRLLVAVLADMLRLSKERLMAKHQQQRTEMRETNKREREKRKSLQAKEEECLELDEVPDSRKKFRKLERLHRIEEDEKMRQLKRTQQNEFCGIHEIIFAKDVVADFFFIGFSERFDAVTKQIIVWMIWELLFEQMFVKQNKQKIYEHELDENSDEEEEDDAEDEEDQDDNYEKQQAGDKTGKNSSDSDDEEDEEYDDDDDDDDEDDEIPNVKSIRQLWREKLKMIFGRPVSFYEIRFVYLLNYLSAVDDVELQITTAQLYFRVSMLHKEAKDECSSIAKAGGIPCLLKLLKSSNHDVQYFSALALRRLASALVHQEIMSARGGFNLLLQLAMDESVPERTKLLIHEILVPLRRHPCNGTRLYQAEMSGVPQELIKRPHRQYTFNPAVESIEISNTPRTKNSVKVRLKPLLFPQFYPKAIPEEAEAETNDLERLEDQQEDSVDSSNKKKKKRRNSKKGSPNNNNNNKHDNALLVGPTFVFPPNGGDSRAKHLSFARYQQEDPRFNDEYQKQNMYKFDKQRPDSKVFGDDMPTFIAPDGSHFHLFLHAAIPQKPIQAESARIEKQLHGILDPLDLDDLCELLNVERRLDESNSSTLLRICQLQVEAQDTMEDEEATTAGSLRISKLNRVCSPEVFRQCHPLLAFIGKRIGCILDDHEQIQVFLVPNEPNEDTGLPPTMENHQMKHRLTVQTFGGNDTSCMYKYNELWNSLNDDKDTIGHDLATGNTEFLKGREKQVLQTLQKYASLLIGIFRFYSVAYRDEEVSHHRSILMMQKASFMKLLVDAKIVTHSERKMKERYLLAFKASIVSTAQRHHSHPTYGTIEASNPCLSLNPQFPGMFRFEFFLCLVRVARVKYPEMKNPEDALAALLQDHIEENLGHEPLLDPCTFRVKRFHSELVSVVLDSHENDLKKMFNQFAGKTEAGLLEGGVPRKRMSFPDWMALMKFVNIPSIHEQHTRQILLIAFALSLSSVQNVIENWKSGVSLSFENFLEAVARLADLLVIPSKDQLELVGAKDVVEFYQFLTDIAWFQSPDLDFTDPSMNCSYMLMNNLGSDEYHTDKRELAGKLEQLVIYFRHQVQKVQNHNEETLFQRKQLEKIAEEEKQEQRELQIQQNSNTVQIYNAAGSPPAPKSKTNKYKRRTKLIQQQMRFAANLKNMEDLGQEIVKAISIKLAKSSTSLSSIHVLAAQRSLAVLRTLIRENGLNLVLENLDDFLHTQPDADPQIMHIACSVVKDFIHE